MKNVNNLTWGLFGYRGRHWWRNIKDIRIWFKRVIFTLKHGYSPQAKWETFAWFIDIMKEILINYRDHSEGIPIIVEDYFTDNGEPKDEENEKTVNELYDRMINLLNWMDETNPTYNNWDYKEKDVSMENAKDEFFKLFSKYFYYFWD